MSETHLKKKHVDNIVAVLGYSLFRRDRIGRKGGGVALYVRESLQATPWVCTGDDRAFELLWVKVNNVFVGALYHPPKPCYATELLLDYLESSVDEIVRNSPSAGIVLAGDINQLSTNKVVERTGLTPLVYQPTRGANVLDQIFVSTPKYSKIHVVNSVVRSDHKAVVAYADPSSSAPSKTTTQRTFRMKTPTLNALFLEHLTVESVDNLTPSNDTQIEFDLFYTKLSELLNRFFPLRTINVSSRDPDFVTPATKAKLRRKNRLMHAGRLDEANALAKLISKEISKH